MALVFLKPRFYYRGSKMTLHFRDQSVESDTSMMMHIYLYVLDSVVVVESAVLTSHLIKLSIILIY